MYVLSYSMICILTEFILVRPTVLNVSNEEISEDTTPTMDRNVCSVFGQDFIILINNSGSC